MVALLYVSVQFKMLDDHCPELGKSAVVDDRSLRGKCGSIETAFEKIQHFDAAAGHITQADKLELLANTQAAKQWAKGLSLDGLQPKVVDRATLVGNTITTTKRGNLGLASKRLTHALAGANKVLATNAAQKLKQRAAAAVAVPRALACTSWTRVASRKLKRLRSAMIATCVGRHRRLRCAEVVTGLVMNPVREDPWGAMVTDIAMTSRRILRKGGPRRDEFMRNLAKMAAKPDEWHKAMPSPVTALVGALNEAGVAIRVNARYTRMILKGPEGPEIDLLHQSKKAVGSLLAIWVRHAILKQLEEDTQGEDPRRKDMVGISASSDRATATSLFRTKKSPIRNMGLKHFRRTLVSVITGSVRAGDRLKAAKIETHDRCPHDGERHTTEHLWWNCSEHAELRKVYIEYMDRVSALANKAGREVGTFIEEIQRNNCFRHTGIPPTDPEAPKWAAARPTESSIDVHHTEAEKILPTEDAVWVEGANGKILAVFTDGSAALTNTEWLSHGGWGVYISAKARTNRGGHLVGWPVTSYRAEVRAMVDAIARAGVRVSVISDNQAAVHTLQAIMKNPASPNQPWKNSDECADYWDWIKHRLEEFPAEYHEAQWMPSHLDEPTRATQRDDFLSKGGDARWIDGNCGADEWANKGARLQAPPAALVLKEKYKRMIIRAARRMMVHIWAVH